MQLDLDLVEVSFSCGYFCKSCLKSFPTMKEISKHSTRHVKHRRKSKTLNYCLEEYGFIQTVNSEIRDMPYLTQLRRVF